jgi:hypothetical protein
VAIFWGLSATILLLALMMARRALVGAWLRPALGGGILATIAAAALHL